MNNIDISIEPIVTKVSSKSAKVYRIVSFILLGIMMLIMTTLCCAVIFTPICLHLICNASASILWWEVPGCIIFIGYSIFIEYCKHMAKAIASEIGD